MGGRSRGKWGSGGEKVKGKREGKRVGVRKG